jgi:phospholipase/carboxylesterase
VSAGLLPAVELEPAIPARSSVIWLHGLGADGHDFEPIVPELGLPDSLAVRFIFPHAPSIPVSINGGMVMPAWYDIRELELRRGHDEQGIGRSAEQVRALIARENERGVESERIVLAGFSQGGAIALHVGLRHPHKLAGVIALSTYLLGEESLARELAPANRRVPIFQAHGLQDPMVPFERGLAARERLLELGLPVEWHTYRMQHAVCPEEIRDIGAWLKTRLGA